MRETTLKWSRNFSGYGVVKSDGQGGIALCVESCDYDTCPGLRNCETLWTTTENTQQISQSWCYQLSVLQQASDSLWNSVFVSVMVSFASLTQSRINHLRKEFQWSVVITELACRHACGGLYLNSLMDVEIPCPPWVAPFPSNPERYQSGKIELSKSKQASEHACIHFPLLLTVGMMWPKVWSSSHCEL